MIGENIVTLGEVPSEFIINNRKEIRLRLESTSYTVTGRGNYDLILSLGQVVPHEVIGMANYNKKCSCGNWRPEGINKSHFLGPSMAWNESWAALTISASSIQL